MQKETGEEVSFEMKTVSLQYNNENFDVEVDEEIFEALKDESVRSDYALKVYEAVKGSAVNLNEPGPSHSTSKSTEFKWNNKAIELLLNIRLGMESAFNNPVCKKKKLWDKVAAQMENIGNYSVSGDVCDMKYRNLLSTYRVNKRKKESSGESCVKWEFFDIMDKELAYKASSSPAPQLIGNTMTDDDDNDESSVDSVGPPLKKKAKIAQEQISVQRYLYLKLEQDKLKNEKRDNREEARWNEKKALKEKEIDALNNLANAINNSLKK